MDVETQTEATQETTTSTEPTRDDLIAAVREAGGTASVNAEAEEQAAKERAGEQATPEPTVDQSLERIMKTREERRAKREDADAYASRVRGEAEAEKQRLIDEARAEAKRVGDAELAELRAKYKGSPTATIRSLGSPEEIVEAVNRESDPVWQAAQAAKEEARLARQEAAEAKGAKTELEKFRAEQAAEKRAAHEHAVRQHFLANIAPQEKAPYLYARFEPQEVFDRCDALCREWQKDGLELGKDFDAAELVAYLEKQSKERITKLSSTSPAQQASAGASEGKPGLAPKVSANGTRTLSVAQGSERRTSPRPFKDLTPEQQREELLAEVAAARRANPDATS